MDPCFAPTQKFSNITNVVTLYQYTLPPSLPRHTQNNKLDSYCFLEIFFQDKQLEGEGRKTSTSGLAHLGSEKKLQVTTLMMDGSSSSNSSSSSSSSISINPETRIVNNNNNTNNNFDNNSDDAVGLSLDYGDDCDEKVHTPVTMAGSTFVTKKVASDDDSKLAARGLMSVSKSHENLSLLNLPTTIQKSMSQELLNRQLKNSLSGEMMNTMHRSESIIELKVSERSGGGLRKTSIRATAKLIVIQLNLLRTFFARRRCLPTELQ